MSAATATPAKKEEKTGLLATVANNARQYGIVGALLVIVVAFEVLTGGVLLKPNAPEATGCSPSSSLWSSA